METGIGVQLATVSLYDRPEVRKAFVQAAELVVDEGVDPAEIGAAVTVELCGHWDHEGPCRWPHNNDIDFSVVPARFRTVFVCEHVEEQEIRARIEDALRGAGGWRVTGIGPRPPTSDEQALGKRLAQTPLPS